MIIVLVFCYHKKAQYNKNFNKVNSNKKKEEDDDEEDEDGKGGDKKKKSKKQHNHEMNAILDR